MIQGIKDFSQYTDIYQRMPEKLKNLSGFQTYLADASKLNAFNSSIETAAQPAKVSVDLNSLFNTPTAQNTSQYEILSSVLDVCNMYDKNGIAYNVSGIEQLREALRAMNPDELMSLRKKVSNSEYSHGVVDKVNKDVLGYKNSESIPYEAWLPANPTLTGNAQNRSRQAYDAIIDQFDVEKNGRYTPYKKGQGDTYCNIFLWDVTKAMDAEIPHWVDSSTGAPRQYPNTKGAYELDANGVVDWLRKHGTNYGWHKVDAQTAQTFANSGYPSVAVQKKEGGIGHVQIVRPSKDERFDASKGVTIAQAGKRNLNYAPTSAIYGSNPSDKLEYYVHN